MGNSTELIGACILCNPGIAVIEARGLYIHGPINEGREFTGVIKADEAIKQIISFVEKLYQGRKLEGIVYIYNIFSLLDAPANVFQNREIDKKINVGVLFKSYRDFEQFADKFPWVLIAWGTDNRFQVYTQKERWLNYIKSNNIPYFGIRAVEYPGYIHPVLLTQSRKEKYIQDLLKQFRSEKLSLKKKQVSKVENNQVGKKQVGDWGEKVGDMNSRVKKMKVSNRLFGFMSPETPTEIKTITKKRFFDKEESTSEVLATKNDVPSKYEAKEVTYKKEPKNEVTKDNEKNHLRKSFNLDVTINKYNKQMILLMLK